MATQPRDRAGEILDGRYRLEELVGRGGMAEVYRAHDRVLDRTVAIKMLFADGINEENLKRHRAEAQIGARNNHPNLVAVFDVHIDDMPYIVLEYVEGETLADLLRQGPLPTRTVAELAEQIGEALAAVHAAGIVHRDVKPSNIMVITRLDGTRLAKLTDFGISRFVEATRLTAPNMVIGTADYLSPEQAAGEAVGPPSDVYALGLVIVECLAGHNAFHGTRAEALAVRAHQAPQVPARFGADWSTTIGAMTRVEPGVRLNATQVVRAMRVLASGDRPTRVQAGPSGSRPSGGKPAAAYEQGPAPPRPPHSVPTSRSAPWGWISAAALLFVCGGLVWGVAQRSTQDAPAGVETTTEPLIASPTAAVATPPRTSATGATRATDPATLTATAPTIAPSAPTPGVVQAPSYPGTPLSVKLRSQSREDVRAVQLSLNYLGYGPVDVDGYYGPKTAAAVRGYQGANGLEPDGIVGPLTWNRLTAQVVGN